ncbi:LLM class flavin-dependent oxidoreductase [Pseudonocardia benzenivorans]|uniref:Luciferase-like, subgroup n=2 Tax=Pseudonocardia TaxID=1847 RepID=F4CPC0_PSEUX|nr:LLM class flavin-dependent oxidoreductase [Pseudonocardia dioxanivorans]AEA24035.1 Luciferase-like, subgroup [Pseudonocardia dioxanivorans CB1190]GJF05237.1 luciferase [Pseudonocardia sp. D17]
MKVGVNYPFGNDSDWDRYKAQSDGPQKVTDQQVLDEQLALVDLIEPLGFDSYWAIDHYITPYGMTGGVLQHLTYVAGRTSRIDLGTMVTVLPWYEPVQLAHQISVLDNVLKGRGLTLGVGRGAAVREFDGFRVAMDDARIRYNETLDILRLALSQEWFEYQGEHFTIPRTSVRPKFRNPERILGSMKSGWASPQSLPLAANAGLGMLLTNQKSWAGYREDVIEFNRLRAEHGWDPVQPTVCVRAACFEDEAEAWDVMSRHNLESQHSSLNHYQLDDVARFAKTKGYEQYASFGTSTLTDEEQTETTARPQAWGTPEQVFERLRRIQKMTGAGEFVLTFKFGNMPAETAERSKRLFAATVLPRLHDLEATLDLTDSDDLAVSPA